MKKEKKDKKRIEKYNRLKKNLKADIVLSTSLADSDWLKLNRKNKKS